MLVFIGSLALVVITAFIQMTNWLLIGAIVKPNLLLVVLVILATLNPGWIKRAILVLMAALIVKAGPGFVLPDLIFAAAALISIILLDVLPWQRTINTLIAASAGTLVVNLFHFTLLPIVYELTLNLFLAFILLNLIQPSHVSPIKLQRHRF